VDSKCYGLLQVMDYHSMGYLRFDCIGYLRFDCNSLICNSIKNYLLSFAKKSGIADFPL